MLLWRFVLNDIPSGNTGTQLGDRFFVFLAEVDAGVTHTETSWRHLYDGSSLEHMKVGHAARTSHCVDSSLGSRSLRFLLFTCLQKDMFSYQISLVKLHRTKSSWWQLLSWSTTCTLRTRTIEEQTTPVILPELNQSCGHLIVEFYPLRFLNLGKTSVIWPQCHDVFAFLLLFMFVVGLQMLSVFCLLHVLLSCKAELWFGSKNKGTKGWRPSRRTIDLTQFRAGHPGFEGSAQMMLSAS